MSSVLHQILGLYDYRTDTELITSYQPLFFDEKRSYDAADVAGQHYKRLRMNTRREFLNEFVRTNEIQERRRDRDLADNFRKPRPGIRSSMPKRTTAMSTPYNRNPMLG